MKRIWSLVVGVGVLSLVAAGCGGGSKTGGEPPAGQANTVQATTAQATTAQATVVDVTLKDFAIAASVASSSAGKVTFQATNNGPSEHEFVVLKTDLSPTTLPLKEDKVAEDADGIKNLGEIEDLSSGKTKSTTLDLPPGRYLFVCNIPGHYKAGMETAFTVT